jgi:leucyl aminopeptidase
MTAQVGWEMIVNIQELEMKILVKKGMIAKYPSGAAVVTHFEDGRSLEGAANRLDKACNGAISEIMQNADFNGKLFQKAILYTRGCIPAKRIIIVGLGKKSDFNLEKLRGAFAVAAREARALNMEEFHTSIDSGIMEWPLEQVTQAVIEGVYLGLYQFRAFKTVENDNGMKLKRFVIVDDRDDTVKAIKMSGDVAQTICRAVSFARDMVSMPSNEMTPTDMVSRARVIGKEKNVKLEVLNPAEMKKLGMHALLGVARGSKEPAKFIILEYRGGKKNDPFIALVGKGLTFDSGGISIKPAEKMHEMKSDMAGGAAVMGAIMAASGLRLNVNVVGLVPAAENLPGGNAYKPGDIIKSLSGQTIEIISTDAEGRLILADALTYAGRYKPAAIVDLATLTGACVIALGDHVTGMMGTADDLKQKIRLAADLTGERVWELPLWEDYHELIKGDAADYKNSGGRPGGAITAAAFLSKFVGPYPWVHLDIAGPAWLTKDKPYIPKGASGVGVRLLVQFLTDWSRQINPS